MQSVVKSNPSWIDYSLIKDESPEKFNVKEKYAFFKINYIISMRFLFYEKKEQKYLFH